MNDVATGPESGQGGPNSPSPVSWPTDLLRGRQIGSLDVCCHTCPRCSAVWCDDLHDECPWCGGVDDD